MESEHRIDIGLPRGVQSCMEAKQVGAMIEHTQFRGDMEGQV